MATYYHAIGNAIKDMHTRYGVGDVKEIQLTGDGRIELIAQGFRMKPHVRRGRITGETFGKRTIRMYGHQRTVVIIGGAPD